MKTLIALCLAASLSGCATRVSVSTPEKTVEIRLPKNYSVRDLDLRVNPATGEISLKASTLSANASEVIASAGSAAGKAIETLAPLAK